MTQLATWSISRSWLWHHCRYQYLLRYVLRAQAAQPTAPNRLYGILVHLGMETAYRACQQDATRQHHPTMLDFLPAASAAMLDSAAAIELPSQRVDSALSEVESLLATLPAPRPSSILGVEHRVNLITPDGTPAEIILDLVLRTGPRSLHIRDYKTGAVAKEDSELEANMQLAFGTAAARVEWPWADTITVGLLATRERREVSRELSLETVEFFTRRVDADAESERAHRAELERMLRDQDTARAPELYPTQTGRHCSACVFRSYCPEYPIPAMPLREGVDRDAVRAERARIAAALDQDPPSALPSP